MIFLGLGDTDPGIQALQKALVVLSQASFRADINPGATDGVLTDATMGAVVSSFNILSAQLSSWQQLTIRGALLLGASTDTARNAITNAAPELAAAALAAAEEIQPLPGGGFFIPTQSFFSSPVGMGVILIGLAIGFKLIISKGKQHASG